MSERYYLNQEITPGPIALDGQEAHHLAHVSRLAVGDEVCLFNGDGHEYPARVVALHKRIVDLEVLGTRSPERELPRELTVAAPLPRGDRGQFLVEKLTELGVTRFVPLLTSRTGPHGREVKADRLRRYVIEASKQCGRNRLMAIAPPTTWSEFIREAPKPACRLLAIPGGADALPGALERDTMLAIGPEGGWTNDEAALARQEGWTAVSLGPRTLRVETAAIALASWFTLSADGHVR